MKVMKFGGTSVGSPQRMKNVVELINSDNEQKIVVLSAMSGTTNMLYEISDYLYKKNPVGANENINIMEDKYHQHVEDLYTTDEYKKKANDFLKQEFDYIRSFTKSTFTVFEEKIIVGQGGTRRATRHALHQEALYDGQPGELRICGERYARRRDRWYM